MKYFLILILSSVIVFSTHIATKKSSAEERVVDTNVVSADELEANYALRPEVITIFEGPSQGGSPPDTEIAVSSKAIVTAENHKLNVFNKRDGAQRLEITFDQFFPIEGPQDRSPLDPHIEYDATNKKFIIVVSAKFNAVSNGYLGLIIGKTDNPTATSDWCGIQFNQFVINGKTLFMDYPGISINPEKDLLVLTTNMYDMKGTVSRLDDVALGARVFKMRLSDAYKCLPIPGAIVTLETRIPGTNCGGIACLAESLHPAQWLDGFSSEKLYLVSHLLPEGGIGNELYIWDFDTDFGSQQGLGLRRVGYSYEKSPGIRQIGGQTFAMNNSPYISHAYFKNNTLYATQDVKNPDANNSAVVFHTIPLVGVGTSVIRKNSNRDYAFQSVMLDKFNNIALGFSQTQFVDPKINFSISVSGLTSDILSVKENEANITNVSEPPRAGDYSDAYLDPNGYDIWIINSYGSAGNRWRSKILKVSFLPRLFIPLMIKG
jgi:hypothetical protein